MATNTMETGTRIRSDRLGTVEFAEVHGQRAELAEAFGRNQQPEPRQADAQQDLAGHLIARKFFQEPLHHGGFGQHQRVAADQPAAARIRPTVKSDRCS